MKTFSEFWTALTGKVAVPDEMKSALEAEYNKSMESGTPRPAPPPTPAVGNPVTPEQFAAAMAEITALKQQLADASALIGKEATERAAATKAIAEQQKAARDKKIADAIEAGVAAGQIPAKNDDAKAKWQKMFEADFDGAAFALENVPKSAAPTKTPATQQHAASTPLLRTGADNAAMIYAAAADELMSTMQ